MSLVALVPTSAPECDTSEAEVLQLASVGLGLAHSSPPNDDVSPSAQFTAEEPSSQQEQQPEKQHQHVCAVYGAEAEQLKEAGIKTTHIVIHGHTSVEELSQDNVKATPAIPHDEACDDTESQVHKYDWDKSVYNPVLPVRCKSTSAELHKYKFGSGGRGKCINAGNAWYTPTEFELWCGRGSSKDWKRSIRYGGRALQCLIEDEIIKPHATSCICAACCDDISVAGPVRLFVPYKRRKKDETGPVIKMLNEEELTANSEKASMVMAFTPTREVETPTLTMNTVTTDVNSLLAMDTSLIDTTAPGTSVRLDSEKPKQTIIMEYNEQKQWWLLEEMANNLINHGQQLKQLIEQAKIHSNNLREAALRQLRTQLEKEKNEAVNAAHIEGQLLLQRALLNVLPKDIGVDHQNQSQLEKLNQDSKS